MKIGLLLIATGKYDQFVGPFLESVDKYFFKDDHVNVYLFSDKSFKVNSGRLTVYRLPIEHKPFPYATLLRYRHFDQNKDFLKENDYLFYSDVDMRFVSEVGREILGDLTVVQHPGFYNGGWGSNNVDKKSLAFLPINKRTGYYAGGFQGGKTKSYLDACNVLHARINDDLSRDIMAEWHDESHWNWYMKIEARNFRVLDPSYCYPESWSLPFEKKLLALDKNHKEVRS
jgi:hypothetical protein